VISDGEIHIKNYNALFKNMKDEENIKKGGTIEKEVKSDDDSSPKSTPRNMKHDNIKEEKKNRKRRGSHFLR